MPQRLAALQKWLQNDLKLPLQDLKPLTNDASFRRYFRTYLPETTHVVMDAPPEKEDSAPYVDIAKRLGDSGLHVPEILAAHVKQGFYLLTDLGDDLYLHALTEDRVERLYGDALAALAAIQVCVPNEHLPPYDLNLLHREMNLFRDWLLPKHLKIQLSSRDLQQLEHCFARLSAAAIAQPQTFVHRDYHSRNLLVTPKHNPGILDFQDAVQGPVTYDLVSLLRDCYIVWPRAQVEEWAIGYHELAIHSGIITANVGEEQFLYWFDWMGLQRHLKVAGIFARLYHRDGKPGYLKDIPTTLRYLIDVSADYPEMAFLCQLTQDAVLPAMLASLENFLP